MKTQTNNLQFLGAKEVFHDDFGNLIIVLAKNNYAILNEKVLEIMGLEKTD
ncbi:hypothetical protein [Bdellovibrio sp. GT3]|uniref:hypothetical protein n=1 Tax=Bdellovibrio sp. GT3 TaxID=3136282 RepID=UPI0030F11803